MNNTYQLVVDAVYKGGGAFQQARGDLSGLDNAARGAGAGLSSTLSKIGVAAGAAGLAVAGVAVAAKKAWSTLGEGAALNRTAERFDKLAVSIGSTANVLTAKLRAATHGTISDMELMANASQLISLRLADNADQVVRLGAVAGTLNWDMQQVILTFANMSKMRLDALGLSVSDVTQKAEELELQGMDSQAAFKEAVILAGEAQKALLDVGDDAVRRMQQAQSGWQNAKDSFKMGMANLADQIGLTGAIGDIGDSLSEIGMSEADKQLKDVTELVAGLNKQLAEGSVLAAALKNQELLQAFTGREQMLGVAPDMTNTEAAIAQLEKARAVYSGNAEVVSVLDAELTKLNDSLAEQERLEAIAAAGGRKLADVYAEWATAMDVQGEQAENFVKNFSAAIGSIATAEIDAGPLITFGQAADGAGVSAGNMQINVESANAALYEAAQAAGASSAELALLGVATGQFTEAEADAALKTAILQEAISRLATKYAEGELSIQGVSAALREQIDIISNMPSMFEAASQAERQFSVLTGGGGGRGITGQPWYRPVAPLVRRDAEELERATPAVRGFSSALSEAEQREKSLVEIHGRMASAFAAEAFGDGADGLIDASGAVNAEALNKALYDQARAAGATAGQLALLGAATGVLSEDQSRAALKAAILTEQAKKLAAAVVSGQMGFGEAAEGMITFGAELDAQAAGQDLASLAAAADVFAQNVYEAELAVNNDEANLGLMTSIGLANDFEGTYTANLVTVYSSVGSPPSDGGTAAGATTTGGAPANDGGTAAGATTTGGAPANDSGTAAGATTTGGAPANDNRSSISPQDKNGSSLLPYGGGSVYPDSRSAALYTNYQGGSSVNVTVTNYVDGKAVGRSNLDDITVDSLKRAMNELGMIPK